MGGREKEASYETIKMQMKGIKTEEIKNGWRRRGTSWGVCQEEEKCSVEVGCKTQCPIHSQDYLLPNGSAGTRSILLPKLQMFCFTLDKGKGRWEKEKQEERGDASQIIEHRERRGRIVF